MPRRRPARQRRRSAMRNASLDQILDYGRDELVEVLERPRVHERVIGAPRLLLVVDETSLAVARERLAPGFAERLRRGDHDDLVEALVAAGLVEERHFR